MNTMDTDTVTGAGLRRARLQSVFIRVHPSYVSVDDRQPMTVEEPNQLAAAVSRWRREPGEAHRLSSRAPGDAVRLPHGKAGAYSSVHLKAVFSQQVRIPRCGR
jgi:hypothetical protein